MDEPETIFRSVMLTIVNSSQYEMDLQDSSLTSPAVWAPDYAPQPDQVISSDNWVAWLAQTDVPKTGVSGYVVFAMPQGGVMQLDWDLPWVEPFTHDLKRLQWFDPYLTPNVVVDNGDPGNVNLQLTLIVQYVVQVGDTVESIAHRFNIPVQQLAALVPCPIQPGMRIIIPPPASVEE